jgi:Zn-dependent protease with chaperone function
MWPVVLSSAENFVLINGALSALAFIVAATLRSMSRTRAWHPLTSSRLYAAALIVPPMFSAWLVIASLLPATWLGVERWLSEHQAAHTLHLLNAFTVPLDPVLGYAALAFALTAGVVAVYGAANAYLRIGRIIRRLEIGAEPVAPERVWQVEDACRRYGVDVGLVVSRYPFSFVWGYLRSKLVVSTGLLNALSSEELSALLEHEAAHHFRRDNLSKWVLTVCKYASPVSPLNRLLYRWWNEQVEMVCDEVAARRTSSPAEVAGALVRIKRLSPATVPGRLQVSESGFFGEGGENFEDRVMRVLSLDEQPEAKEAVSLSRSWARPAALVGSVFVLTLVTLFVVSPLAIHRLVEVLLHAF